MTWEQYLALPQAQRAVVRFCLLMAALAGQVEALTLAYALVKCGIGWDPEAGAFVVRGEAG